MDRTRQATLLGIGVMWFIGGSIYPFLSNATKFVEPANIILIRSIGAAIIMFIAVLIIDRKSLKLIKFDKSLIPIVGASILFSPICSGSLAWASDRIPGAVSALMYSTLPAMSILFLLAQGKKQSRSSIYGVVVASIAVIFLIGAPQGQVQFAGVLAALLSVFAWFAATEIWIKYETGYPLILAIFLQVAFGTFGTVLVRPFIHAPSVSWSDITNPNMIFLVFALASQYWAYLGISRRVSPAVLTSFGFVNPLVAGVIGYLLFDQVISIVQAIAGAILLLGVFLVVREDLSKRG